MDTDKLWFMIHPDSLQYYQQLLDCKDFLHHKRSFPYVPWLLKQGIKIKFAWVKGGTYVINWSDIVHFGAATGTGIDMAITCNFMNFKNDEGSNTYRDDLLPHL